MRCGSVVGIWPETPPSHRVTAIAAIDQPPTIFTGADDGSILWWSISGDESSKDVKPVAILCGHTSSIAGLGICYPLLASVDVSLDHPSEYEASDLASSQSSALVSACTEGVLCVWSHGSRHCRRRRKLPPWAGSPCALEALPSNPRFVCIASSILEGHYISDHNYTDAPEDVVCGHGDKDIVHKRPPKCSIVIVDSYTLTITQTVFHGNLSVESLKFMDIVTVQRDDETKKHSILLIDALGKLQQVPVLRDLDLGIEVKSGLVDISSYAHKRFWDNGSHGDGHVLSITSTGKMLGLVYKTHCTFMLVDSEAEIGMLSLKNDLLHSPSDLMELHAVGGMFFHVEDQNNSNVGENLMFIVWNTRGFAVVYRLSYNDLTLKSEIVCEIPAACHNNELPVYTDFIQLNNYLLRIESVCFDNKEPYSWKPHITIWSLPFFLHDNKDLIHQCKMLGEGDLFSAWNISSRPSQIIDGSEPTSSSLPVVVETLLETENNVYAEDHRVPRDGLKCTISGYKGTVTSSMVISHYDLIPYAVVYGYHNGDIELAQLEGFLHESLLDNEGPHHEMKYREPKQKFSGHTGAVLCLAVHSMMTVSDEQNYSDVLISGSMDGTVRIWDLKTGYPVKVMHNHVAPVRQIILPPLHVDRPWSDCFLSVGEDGCVSLTSLLTLRVERMFPGHPDYPLRVVWDGLRGYLACLSQNHSSASGAKEVLFIWDIKTGSLERTLHGTASHSMFENFCKRVSISHFNTSTSSLHAPLMDGGGSPQPDLKVDNTGSDFLNGANTLHGTTPHRSVNSDSMLPNPGIAVHHEKLPIRCSCPSSGIAVLSFDLASLMSCGTMGNRGAKKQKSSSNENEKPIVLDRNRSDLSAIEGSSSASISAQHEPDKEIATSVLRFSLAYLHMWDVQPKLDNLLLHDMMLWKPGAFTLSPGLQGDRGSVTIALPGFSSSFELWRSSSEFTAMRSLTMVSLAQCMIGVSNSCSLASSTLSAFYTRNLAEKFPHIKPPSLQLLVSFWQHEDEHVRMAARTLFHCSAARAIPPPLCRPKTLCQAQNLNLRAEQVSSQVKHMLLDKTNSCLNAEVLSNNDPSSGNKDLHILKWMESYEMQDWISCVGGTSQDAMASHIIVASALAIWYPSLVKDSLANLAVHSLIKLVMAMSEKYSSTAAELLAEGMDTTWKLCIQSEIPRLIRDLFFQIECVSGGASVRATFALRPAVPPKIRETLVGVLLPSLALANILEFLSVIEGLIWSTASDSPVHLISVKILIRVIRGSPRSVAQYLDKVINFILLTLDPSNSVMRRTCFQSSITALKEAAHAFPMVALNESVTRLAVGDAIAETNGATVHVYDVQSAAKIKVLDASGPPGLPNLLQGVPGTIATAISALSFSPDGEGVVGFSENGLIIRWWSVGTVWWEKLSRSLVPVQCTKLIFVPPWEGFSPSSSRISVMENIAKQDGKSSSQDHKKDWGDADYLNSLILNLDLMYRLQWAGNRVVNLTRHGNLLGSFQL